MHVCACLSDVCVGVWGNMFSGYNCMHWIVNCGVGSGVGGGGEIYLITCVKVRALPPPPLPPPPQFLYIQNDVVLV